MASSSQMLRVLVVCLLGATSCYSLQITRLSIPSFVPNGSEESVVLDCEYTYTTEEVKKLVVKWFHEDDPKPVYQWIPELDAKQTSEKFRVDEDYEVEEGNEYTRSRALRIMRPTTDLSGRYSCQVQALNGQDSAEDFMTVYALPSSVSLNYSTIENKVRVVCEVENVFPLPEMELFQIAPGSVDTEPIDDVDLDFTPQEGAYDVELSADLPEEDLRDDSVEGLRYFGCIVVINGTEYEKVVRVPYFPDPVAEKQEGEDTDEVDDNSLASSLSSSLVLIFSILPLLLHLT